MSRKQKSRQEFDPRYLREKLELVGKRGLWSRAFDGYKVLGIENLKEAAKNSFVGIGNHLSHFDYMHLPKVFYENGLTEEFPRITTGTNLDNGIVRFLLADFDKCNVLWTDRNRMNEKDYISQWRKEFAESLRYLDNLFVFPDAGRNWTGKPLRKKINGLAKTIIGSLINPNIFFIDFNYDNLIEAKYMDGIERNRGKKNIVNRSAYTFWDVASFASRLLKSGKKGNAYIWFGEPKKVSDIIDKESILNFQRESVNNPSNRDKRSQYNRLIASEAKRFHEHVYGEIVKGLRETEHQKVRKIHH